MNSYKLAERINSDVNASVTYKTDLAQYGKPEHWLFFLHDYASLLIYFWFIYQK